MIETIGAKLASPALGLAAKQMSAKWNTWKRRLTKETAKAMEFDVPKRQLRGWLGRPKTIDLFASHDFDSAQALAEDLAATLRATSKWRGLDQTTVHARTERLIDYLLDRILYHADPSIGIGLHDDRSAAQIYEVRAEVRAEIRALHTNKLDPERLQLLHPAVARAAKKAFERLPQNVHTIVGELTDEMKDPVRVIRSWQASPPDWANSADSAIYLLLSQAAASYEEEEAARVWLRQAVTAGAAPAGYYLAKAALLDFNEKQLHDRKAESLPALTAHLDDDHLAPIAVAVLNEEWTDVRYLAAAWQPTSEADRDLRAILRAMSEIRLDNPLLAIPVLQEREADSESASVLLQLAGLLQWRAQAGKSDSRDTDLRRSCDLALRARDMRRSWRGNSIEPVLAAALACTLAHDSIRALSICVAQPEGEATPAEAQDERVQSRAAFAAAGMGNTDLARQMAGALKDPFEIAWLEAILFEADSLQTHGIGDDGWPEESVLKSIQERWQKVYALATTSEQIVSAAQGLVTNGIWPIEGLDRAADEQPDAIEQLEQLAVIWKPDIGDRVTHLRSLRNTSKLAAYQLGEIYRLRGQARESAKVLTEAAIKFDDPFLRAIAIDTLASSGDASALVEARAALSWSPPHWTGRGRLLRTVLQLELDAHEWGNARDTARQLLSLEPSDEQGRWILAFCYAREAQFPEAWEALTRQGPTLWPATTSQAETWLVLHGRYGTPTILIPGAARLFETFGEDEELAEQIMVALYNPMRRQHEDLDEELASQLQDVTRQFLDRFPDSPAFRSIDFKDPEQFLQRAGEMLKAGALRHREIREQIRRGELPVGVLSAHAHRSYAEAWVTTAPGFLPLVSANPAEVDLDLETARTAVDARVVADASSIHSLAILRELPALTGHFESVVLTDAAFKDIVLAHETLASRNTSSITFDYDEDNAAVSEISSEAAELLAARSEYMLTAARSLSRQSRPALEHLTQFDNFWFRSWIEPVDFAIAENVPLWTDDSVLRRLARSHGVRTFGTFSLLLELRRRDAIDETVLRLAKHTLTRAGAALPIEETLLLAVAEEDQWSSFGVSSTLSRRDVWQTAEVGFSVLNACLRNTTQKPIVFATWIACAARGLFDLHRNVEMIGRMGVVTLHSSHCNPEIAAHSIAALRQVAKEHAVPDPLEFIITKAHASFVANHGETAAAQLIISLTSNLNHSDRLMVTRVLLRNDRS